MVQVDVFWAYGLGASLGAMAGRQLKEEDQPFYTHHFVKTLIFLSLFWAPTGLLLLLTHPSWECMQVPDALSDLPTWLVLGFGITNITQGILGFWVTVQLFKKGQYYLAHLNWLAGYLGMFFILVYGWDGLGWDRFLYDRDMFPGSPAWHAGLGLTVTERISFLWSGVALTLYTAGLILIPPLVFLYYHFDRTEIVKIRAVTDKKIPHFLVKAGAILAIVFIVGLGSAMGAAYTVHLFKGLVGHVPSYFIGVPVFAAWAYALLYRKGMPIHRLFKILYVAEPNDERYV